MAARKAAARELWMVRTAGFALVAMAGCRGEQRVGPAVVANEWLGPATVAVAPALNLSGSADFDPARFADLMASELSYADGVSVIPVSRVLAAMAVTGSDRISSADEALDLIALLGADAILVFAVTEYDPYVPPSIGISAQLYGARTRPGDGSLDAVALSRQTGLADASPRPVGSRGLLARTQRVFDASHEYIVAGIRRFAAERTADPSPYGWRRYVVSQQEFVRYCCHATIRELLAAEQRAVVSDAVP